MKIATATGVVPELGPLTKLVNAFTDKQGEIVAAGISSPLDWEPLTAFLEADQFKRVGAYLEVFDWPQYREFLTSWAAGGTRFEFTIFHMTEVGNAVFQEIEERHHRGAEFIRKNVIAVYRFNDRKKLIHLDIYEQAQDSGRWIKEAAQTAVAAAPTT
ncbi:MAG: hypothetical protein EPO08_03265 [Rhodospirillaceae bacterium]|nr:MAG: hypothetical protein EPO08_03265 [Rhodospirillaceae bacterium]